jgi:hypothetical protein
MKTHALIEDVDGVLVCIIVAPVRPERTERRCPKPPRTKKRAKAVRR